MPLVIQLLLDRPGILELTCMRPKPVLFQLASAVSALLCQAMVTARQGERLLERDG